MLQRIEELFINNESYAFETTLASKSYKQKILKAKKNGYHVTLLFFWLNTIELAQERVKIRVSEGGHNIEPDVIERRYKNGIINLFDIYLPIVDQALIFDNSDGSHDLIAEQSIDQNLQVVNFEKFNLLDKYNNDYRRI
jgi:predicted ABC-type ATPase